MNSPNFDTHLLQTLINKLQINPINPQLTPNLIQTLELDELDHQDDDFTTEPIKTHLAVEELKLEKELINIITSGNGEEKLKANSGQAVAIGEHYVCVGCYSEAGSEYRVWEWHGHVMVFDEETGYDPEYVYGNYFERVKVEKVVNCGLKELIRSSEGVGSGASEEYECRFVAERLDGSFV
ncbi:uncharacterized protein LOC143605290 [Bidens hawaiensis]|uniref:uncharacterized protein LOC143605290 n=1 Tax=Bidens hawaiensis TaxID=980011 RepID=UPI00404B0B32